MRTLLILTSIFFLQTTCYTQLELNDYLGGWSGDLQQIDHFKFKFQLTKQKDGHFSLAIQGKENRHEIQLDQKGNNSLVGELDNQAVIKIDVSAEQPDAFIQIGNHLAFLDFKPKDTQYWVADWNLLLADDFDPTFYLSLDQLDDGSFAASAFFQSPVCHYMYGQNFVSKKDEFSFIDIRSGISFQGKLAPEKVIKLEMSFLQEKIDILLNPKDYPEWVRGESDLQVSEISTQAAEDDSELNRSYQDVLSGKLEGTHSIVVARNNQIIFECYFDEFTKDVPHDTRSLAKSFAGAITGLAIQKGLIESELEPIKGFFTQAYPNIDWTNGKDKVNLHHLLTMSSGLDAIDFGLNRQSYANESNYQNTADWTKHILSAPMVYSPGEMANYGSGSPHLLAPIVASTMEEDLAFFTHRNLFGPLGITNYRIQISNQGSPYFGGGWYLTPRDIVKFGMLYLNGGKWEGEQIIAADWVKKSMQKHTFLANADDKNKYGYFFWHKTYQVNGQAVESIEARGAGGQYLFIVPDYNVVVVITSGNYSNNKAFQPESIMEKYVLKALIK